MLDSAAMKRRAIAHTQPTVAVLRFDVVERAAHWANAVLFTILILTALPLYFPAIESFVGRRLLVEEIHTWSGIALPVPLVACLAGSWGTALRRDLRRCSLWTREEVQWLRTFGRERIRNPDKFNPGQKLNAAFVGGVILVMLASGSVLKWFDDFPIGWRTGATFVHDVFALLVVIVVAGHIAFALMHRDALRSMWKGWIPREWARRHASGWLREIDEGRASRSDVLSEP